MLSSNSRPKVEGMSRSKTIIAGAVVALTALLVFSLQPGEHARERQPPHLEKDELVKQIDATVATALDKALLRARDTAPAPAAQQPAAPPEPAAALAAVAAEQIKPDPPLLAPVNPLPASERALRDAQLRVNYSRIFMSPMETDLVLRHLVTGGGVRTYLEWGSGGSTTNFAQFARERAFSIEHTEDWCKRMRPQIAAHPGLKHLEYRCVPLALPNSREGSYVEFRAYVDEIDKLNQKTFDVVLVDGRVRVSCAIKALSYITPQSKVVLHDAERIHNKMTDPYTSYKPILDYYDVVDSVGGRDRQGLFILRRKKEYDYVEGNHATVQQLLNGFNGVNA